MARLTLLAMVLFGLCSAFGETPQEKRMLDSLIHRFLTNKEDAEGLHKKLGFFELPDSIDTEKIAFDEPLRCYRIRTDSTQVKSTNFKIKDITEALEGWRVPFKYDGRYVGTFSIEKIEGKFRVDELKQGNGHLWEVVEKRVGRDKKRKGTQFLRYGSQTYLHSPAIDEYNLLQMFKLNHIKQDTVSQGALNSPLTINNDLARQQLRDEIIENHRKMGVRRKK